MGGKIKWGKINEKSMGTPNGGRLIIDQQGKIKWEKILRN